MSNLSNIDSHVLKDTVAALRRLQSLELRECMNINDLSSRPTLKQQEVFKAAADAKVRVVLGGNQSSKSTLGAREVAWVFENIHPYWHCKSATRKILVIGRVGEQVETELWRSKIKPFLTPGTYKEVRIGNILQRVESLTDDAVIIFMSHHNINEAREKAQAFVADFVWLDELADSPSFVIELMFRIQSNNGRLILTFTPLLRSPELKRWVETLDPSIGKVFKLNTLDNPLYKGREQEILASLANASESERNTRLYGEWLIGDNAVFSQPAHTYTLNPIDYHPSWRHIEVVDPAASGSTGYMILAQPPTSRTWYVVKADYVDGAAASDLLLKIQRKSSGLNIVRRISDPHEVWFIKEAHKFRVSYIGVRDKARRKLELINQTQESLLTGRVKVASWCTSLLEELGTAQWQDNGKDRIQNSSKYHLLDCLQYGVDNLPKDEVQQLEVSHHAWIREANKERLKREAQAKAAKSFKPRLGSFRGRKWKRA